MEETRNQFPLLPTIIYRYFGRTGPCSCVEGKVYFSPAIRISSSQWTGGFGVNWGRERERVGGVYAKATGTEGVRDLLNKVNLFFHDLFLLGSPLAIAPQIRGSPAGATLQIHEAGETHKLGICMIITGRGKHWNYLASHGWTGLLLRQWWGRDKWGGENSLILIKSVCLFQ